MRLFVFATSFLGTDDEAIQELVARTWPSVPRGGLPKASRRQELELPLGTTTLVEATLDSALDVAIARISVCDDPLLALHAIQYGTRGSAGVDLRTTLGELSRIGAPRDAPICARLRSTALATPER